MMLNSTKTNRVNSKVSSNYFAFFLWPIWGLIFSILHFNSRSSRIVILAFFCLFGYAFVIPNESFDSSRIVNYLVEIANQPFSNFFKLISGLFTDKDLKPDFVLNLIYFIVSRFTTNGGVLMLVLALVAGYFLIQNINYLYQVYLNFPNRSSLVFLVLFILLTPIFSIGQFRFYAATLFFIWGVYPLLCNSGDKKYFIITLLSIFFHFSFLLPVSILGIYIFLGNRNSLYLTLLVSSFFLSEFTAPYLSDIANKKDTGNYEGIITGYTSDSYKTQTANKEKTTTAPLLKIYHPVTKYFLLLSMLLIKFRNRKIDIPSENLFSFSILILTLSNYFEGISDVSARFGGVFSILAVIFMIRYYYFRKSKKMNIYSYIGVFIVLMNFIVVTRYYMQHTNVSLFLPTFIAPFIMGNDFSVLNIFRAY